MSIFNTVQFKKPNSNTFDLSHDHKYSMKMGYVYPIMLMECVPGDKIRIKTETLLRMAPMLAPIMHKVDVFTHQFFVPNRIVWPEWEEFIAPKVEGAVPPAFPITSLFVEKGSMADFFGLPLGNNVNVSAIPFAGYNMIWDEYYRDQNLSTSIFSPLVSGVNNPSEFALVRKRAWEHDYFTSALPWPQKGPAVTLPLGDFTDVPVYGLPERQLRVHPVQTGGTWGTLPDPFDLSVDKAGSNEGFVRGSFGTGGAPPVRTTINPETSGFMARTSEMEAEAVTMNSLRRAEALQKWFEKMARAGTRYIEVIRAHFGVNSSDARLNRPEYITGSKQNVVISEVLQTSETTTDSAQGSMAGHGLSVGSGGGKSYFCEEHGYYYVMISVIPKTAYQQGVPKTFLKKNREEFFWPDFANIGEQEILNRELYQDGTPADDEVFGYTPRYAEYKFMNSRVSGDFRDNLSFWHMGRIFATRPNLNASFVESDPTKRIFAVEDEDIDSLWCHSFHQVAANRRMPVYGTPTL